MLELVMGKMRQRAKATRASGATIKHPWLMAIAAEVAAELGDAIVYQRHRAAAAIDRAVAAQQVSTAAEAGIVRQAGKGVSKAPGTKPPAKSPTAAAPTTTTATTTQPTGSPAMHLPSPRARTEQRRLPHPRGVARH